MKKVYLFVKMGLAACVFIALVGLVSTQCYKQREMVLRDLTQKMTESWQKVVVIKNSKIMYSGDVNSVYDYLLEHEVLEIANCEDSFAVTVIIK